MGGCQLETPRVMRTLIQRYSKKVQIRPLNRKNFKAEMEILRDLFNDAWSDNWGFIPFTEAEFAELSVKILVPALILFMAFVVWDLMKKSGAGKFGGFVLFLALGLGTVGYIAKLIIQYFMEI